MPPLACAHCSPALHTLLAPCAVHRCAVMLLPLNAMPQTQLEKATWDLRAQLAAVARVLGRAALGVPGAEAPGGATEALGLPRMVGCVLPCCVLR